jgi:signal transduction histidine kinase
MLFIDEGGIAMSREIRPYELVALKEIAEMLNRTNEMDQMLNDVLKKLLDVTGFTTGWIFMLEEPGDQHCKAACRLPEALAAQDQAVMRGSECWCMESFRQDKLSKAVNIIECSRISYAVTHQLGDTESISHHATVPLKAGGDRFGLLNVAEAGRDRFTEEELELLQAVAYQIGTAIKRIKLYQAQERNATLYAKLNDVIQQMNTIQDIRKLPQLAVQCIGDAFGWQHVSLFIHEQRHLSLRASYSDQEARAEWRLLSMDEAGPVSTAFREKRLVLISDSGSAHGPAECPSLAGIGIPTFAAAAAIPLRNRSCPIGVLLVSSNTSREFDEYHEDFMYALGNHFTLCVENLRVYEQQREIARMEERNRMALDLHDSVIQKMFSLSFMARGAETALAGKEPLIERSLREMSQLSRETLKEMRELIWQLRPAGLEHGLLPALKQYGHSMGLQVLEQAEGVRELPRQTEEALWRIGQEAINNVSKHAGVDTVYIRLVKSGHSVCLEVLDRGKGFQEAALKGRMTMGMLSMRERAHTLGGELTIESGGSKPTVITATLPLDRSAHAGVEE